MSLSHSLAKQRLGPSIRQFSYFIHLTHYDSFFTLDLVWPCLELPSSQLSAKWLTNLEGPSTQYSKFSCGVTEDAKSWLIILCISPWSNSSRMKGVVMPISPLLPRLSCSSPKLDLSTLRDFCPLTEEDRDWATRYILSSELSECASDYCNDRSFSLPSQSIISLFVAVYGYAAGGWLDNWFS